MDRLGRRRAIEQGPECAGHPERTDRVHFEHPPHVVEVDRGELATALPEGPGVVDQQVDSIDVRGNRSGRVAHRRVVGHVTRQDPDRRQIRSRPREIRGGCRVPTQCEDSLADRAPLPHELEPEPAVGAGDHQVSHR